LTEENAIAHARSLAENGLHHQDPDTPVELLAAEPTTFQGLPAWQVSGQGHEYFVSKAAAEYPIKMIMFECQDSDWLWTLVLSTDKKIYIPHLRRKLNTFECPVGNKNR
jgi:hypothetical protein